MKSQIKSASVSVVSPNYTTRRIKEINQQIEILNHKIDAVDETWDFKKDFYEYQEALEPYSSEVEKLDRERRLITNDYTLEPISKGSTVMTLKQFIKNVKCGGFIDYDGSGNYAIGNEESNISIYPSDVEFKSLRKDFDKVVWYNR